MKSNEVYSQPEFYKFSQDSTLLSSFVAENYHKQKDSINVLDLCCGCGVVGIEFVRKFGDINKISFLEVQNEFEPHIFNNIKNYIPETNFEIIINSLCNYSFPRQFDLIISNPPYYLNGSGRESENLKKMKCHFISAEDFFTLIAVAKNCLAPGGKFYFSGISEQAIIKDYLNSGLIKEVQSLGRSSIFILNSESA